MRGSQQHLLIKSLTPRSGEPLEVGTITALVGPNNSGKTAVLRDIQRLAANLEPADDPQAQPDAPRPVVLEDLTYVGKLTVERLVLGLSQPASDSSDEMLVQGIGPDLKTPMRRTVRQDIKQVLYRPMMTARAVATTSLGELMPLRLVYLDARRRARVIAATPACSPTQAPDSLLQLLHYAPREVHAELDEAFAAGFEGLHLRLDDTQRVHLTLRVADAFPPPADDPIVAVQQQQQLCRLDEQGDGQQSFAAVVLTMLLCRGRIVLIDQPAAFLHPDQARRLGAWIANHTARLSCQVFLAVHQPALLEGLFEGVADVTLVRVERRGDVTSLHSIPHEAGSELARHPLFSSQHCLDCLLAEGVVLVPEEADRLVYETVARRMLGADQLRLLHCHGAANLQLIAAGLRRLGVPLCVIAELDVFRKESSFAKLVKAVTGSDPPQPWLATRERLAGHVERWFDEQSLSSSAHEVESYLDQLKGGDRTDDSTEAASAVSQRQQQWERLKRERLDVLPPDVRSWVEELVDELKQRGIFISPKGNARAWLSDMLSHEQQGPWLVQAVQALAAKRCPADLHAFVTDVVAHLRGLRLPTRAARSPQTT